MKDSAALAMMVLLKHIFKAERFNYKKTLTLYKNEKRCNE